MASGKLVVLEGGMATPAQAENENDTDRLRRITAPDALSVELVSAFAGDRDMTDAEGAVIRALKDSRGNNFYSDLFYAISHHYFAPEMAETLWHKVLWHKHTISERLGRNIRITVAALDYLSNITGDLKAPTLINESYVSEIANLSMRDGMTGLFNHSSCYELLELEIRNHRRYGVGVAVLIMDIDDFKLVNDRHGHQEGDRILNALAKTLLEQTRVSDISCRFGGEEFVVILPLTNDPNEACEIAERIRAKVMNITCGELRMTVSVGVALYDDSLQSARALIEKADRALYKAKIRGKNQVVLEVQ